MSAMLLPSWSIPGVCTELRELKTKEGKVWAHSVKIVAMGLTAEATTNDPKVISSVGIGEPGIFTGTFDLFNGSLKLKLSKFEGQPSPTAAAPARPAASNGNGAATAAQPAAARV